jgi:histidinol-phosphatase (PHP family)
MKAYRIDLHNHTTYCNHATGTIDEYIQKAIDLGIDIYGFSEHAPMEFDYKYRLSFNQMQEYQDKIIQAKNRYKDQIEIKLGYEVDYLVGYIDDRVIKSDVDYLIGSVHFLNKWGFDNPEFIGQWQNRDIDEIYTQYFQAIADMAKSGLFDIVGHFDLIKVFKFLPQKDIKLLALDALKAIKKANMTLEINSAGLRKPIGEVYPSYEILSVAYELGIDICFGSDAHSIEQVGFGYDQALAMAKKAGYTKAVTFTNRDRELIKI